VVDYQPYIHEEGYVFRTYEKVWDEYGTVQEVERAGAFAVYVQLSGRDVLVIWGGQDADGIIQSPVIWTQCLGITTVLQAESEDLYLEFVSMFEDDFIQLVEGNYIMNASNVVFGKAKRMRLSGAGMNATTLQVAPREDGSSAGVPWLMLTTTNIVITNLALTQMSFPGETSYTSAIHAEQLSWVILVNVSMTQWPRISLSAITGSSVQISTSTFVGCMRPTSDPQNSTVAGTGADDEYCPNSRGISIDGGWLALQDSLITRFNSSQSGACLALTNSVHGLPVAIFGTEFNDCHSDAEGGAIFINAVPAYISDSAFVNCSARKGGSLSVAASNVTIVNTHASRSSATAGNGGTMYCLNAQIDIAGCRMSDSSASDAGGVLSSIISSIRVSDSVLERSTAAQGGALHTLQMKQVDNCNLQLAGVLLQGNSASEDGGVMHLSSTYTVVERSTFNNNTAGASSLGGAVYACAGSSLTWNSCRLESNTAGLGGAAVIDASEWFLLSSAVINNRGIVSAGGIAVMEGAAVNITECVLQENHAAVQGGALWFIEGTVGVVIGSQLVGNSVDGAQASSSDAWKGGGGFALVGSSTSDAPFVSFQRSTLSGNSVSSGAGGGGMWTWAPPMVSECPDDSDGSGGDSEYESSEEADAMTLKQVEMGHACLSWENNSVTHGGFGPQIASTVTNLEVYPSYITSQLSYYDLTTPFQVTMVDYYGQEVTIERGRINIESFNSEVYWQ
ncbi:hypothetical protein CYMTET_33017, partial [Cymbomonas tetramitiformis]